MKNFDSERRSAILSEDARTFVIGGETFVLKPAIHPDTLSLFDPIGEGSKMSEVLEIVDAVFAEAVEGGQESQARWQRVRASRDNVVPLSDLLEFTKWVTETATSRPTEQPSPSSNGHAATGTTLTDVSSPQDSPVVQLG